MTRWDPWVRGTLAVTELTRHLSYEPLGSDSYRLHYHHLEISTTPSAPLQILKHAVLMKMDRPTPDFFAKQLTHVQSWAELRDERAPEILAQIDNQFAFVGAVTGLNVSRKKWTMEWLLVAIQLTIEVELMFKHAFASYRPVDYSPQVQPIITTPGHSTYPMGHAAQAFATVVALMGLLKIPDSHPLRTQLVRQARRISINRVVAGVHFPIDAPAGQLLGETVGEYFLSMSGIPGKGCFFRSFGPSGSGDDDENDYLGDGPMLPQGGYVDVAPLALGPASRYLTKLQELARAEWDLP
ncbi:phosphatase PAP2 family protein [Variovorax dokdonensis]|uniref:Phosphatase PAP2 family protein n=1 Tax=Variovorax dokdonensis TaxID=344883 RepID=A0ABT7NCQ2_9BURK|nr:phosphatase PAP2 family protein [Variovorax dokdonensis]MDM0045708.1 phosphatase PAP2 family protein [Variovorax dokdonensis]